jgi:hypothetical protein
MHVMLSLHTLLYILVSASVAFVSQTADSKSCFEKDTSTHVANYIIENTHTYVYNIYSMDDTNV